MKQCDNFRLCLIARFPASKLQILYHNSAVLSWNYMALYRSTALSSIHKGKLKLFNMCRKYFFNDIPQNQLSNTSQTTLL